MATIEDLVEAYRQAGRRPGDGELELEVRFEQVEFRFICLLITELLELVKAGSFEVKHSRSLNTIRSSSQITTARVLHNNRVRGPQDQYVWVREFVDRKERRDNYYIKKRIGAPSRIRPAPGVPGYKIVLSTETPTAPFSKENVRFRVKNRLSFTPTVDRAESSRLAAALKGWRLDITIVRELPESSVSSLPEIVREVFSLDPRAPEQTPQNLLNVLGLVDSQLPTSTTLANQQLYKYEVELEFVGQSSELGAEKIQAAVLEVLRLSNPSFILDAQMQSEVHDAATHIYKSQAMLQKFASGIWGLKQLTPPAVAPTRSQYMSIYPPIDYYLTDKAHGIRGLAIIRDKRLVLVAPGLEHLPLEHKLEAKTAPQYRPLEEFYIEGKGAPTIEGSRPVSLSGEGSEGLGMVEELTILDGEVLFLEGAAGKKPKTFPFTFLVFDAIVVRGEELAAQPFEERVQTLSRGAEAVRVFGLDCRAKPFVHLADDNPEVLAAQFKSMYTAEGRNPPRDYEIDGLILYSSGEDYANTTVYKWKPLGETTNDFLARRPPASIMGRPPFMKREGYDLYFLFVGISQDQFRQLGMTYCPGYDSLFPANTASQVGAYFPIQFQPSDQPYAYMYYHPADGPAIENQIVELRLTSPEGADGIQGKGPAPTWELVRVRTDRAEDLQKGRLFGNNISTAERNWLNYRDPLTFEMLSEGTGESYFSTLKAGIYSAPTKFISYAKSEIMAAHLGGLKFVVDLGSGKGQDLGRYRQAQVNTVVMVDESQPALAELVRRKFEWKPRGRSTSTRILVQKGDFTAPHADLEEKLRMIPSFPEKGVDAVVCNLAAHYAFGTKESMINFAVLVQGLVRPGGQAIFTLMDGHRVLELLTENNVPPGAAWEAREAGVLKYSILRQFREKKLTPAGQKIGVVLPFSNGKHYEEYLSNVSEFVKVMGDRGFTIADYQGLWEKYESGFQSQRHNYIALTDDDRAWLKLFVCVRFVKRPKST